MLKKFSILKVRFESGPIGAQDVEIRVTDTPVQNNQVYLHNVREFSADELQLQGTNSMLTDDGSEVCGGAGNTIDGLNTMDVCCNKLGQFVTIQVTDPTNSLPLGKERLQE